MAKKRSQPEKYVNVGCFAGHGQILFFSQKYNRSRESILVWMSSHFWSKGKYNKNLDDGLMDCSICQDVSLLSDFNKKKVQKCFQQIYKKQQSSSELGGNHRPPRKGGERKVALQSLARSGWERESGLRHGGKLRSSDALTPGTTNFSLGARYQS